MATYYIRLPQQGGGTGVTSLNSETGAITLVPGSNITVTPSGQNITIASSGGAPGGSTNQFQYNNSGVFAGSSNLVNASGRILVGGATDDAITELQTNGSGSFQSATYNGPAAPTSVTTTFQTGGPDDFGYQGPMGTMHYTVNAYRLRGGTKLWSTVATGTFDSSGVGAGVNYSINVSWTAPAAPVDGYMVTTDAGSAAETGWIESPSGFTGTSVLDDAYNGGDLPWSFNTNPPTVTLTSLNLSGLFSSNLAVTGGLYFPSSINLISNPDNSPDVVVGAPQLPADGSGMIAIGGALNTTAAFSNAGGPSVSTNGIGIGLNSAASQYGVGIGIGASGLTRGVGIGYGASGSGDGSVGIGEGANAGDSSGRGGVGLGYSANAGQGSVSIGYGTISFKGGVAIGTEAFVGGQDGSVAIGGDTQNVHPASVPYAFLKPTVQVGGGTSILDGGLNFGLGPATGTTYGVMDNNGAFYGGTTLTTVNGTVSGSYSWTMPFVGPTYKKFILNMAAFHSTGKTVTYPTAFVKTPFIYGDSTAIALCSTNTTTLTIGTTAAASITGNVFVEGY